MTQQQDRQQEQQAAVEQAPFAMGAAATPFGLAGRRAAFFLTLVYAAVGGLWVWAGDTLLALVSRDAERLTRLQTAKGWLFVLLTSLLVYGLIRLVQGQAARRLAESQRLGRRLAMFGNINQAILRSRHPRALYRRICQIAVRDGGYPLAWIGLVDAAGGRLQTAAVAGRHAQLLEQHPLTLEEVAGGCGMAGPVSQGEDFVCANVAHAGCGSALRVQALRLGYRSACFTPVIAGGRVRAVLALFAAEAGIFTRDGAAGLLHDLAADIGLAMRHTEAIQARRRAQHDLAASENLAAGVMNAIHDPLAVLAPDGHILRVNPAWARFALANGGDAATATGVGLDYFEAARRAFPDETAQRAEAGLRALLAGELSMFELEYPCHSPTEQRWFQMQATPLGGSQPGLVVLHTDVSARVRRERAVRDSQQRLALVLASTAEGIYVTDREGRLTLVNAAALRLLGYDDDSGLLGRNIHDIIHNRHADGSPYPASQCPLLKALEGESGVATEGELFWRRDGRPFPVACRAEPMRVDGAVQGVVITFSDISQRLAAEERQRQAAVVFEATGDGITFADAQGNILSVNPAFERITGYSRAEVIGRNPRLLSSGRHGRAFYQAMWASIHDTGRWSGEIWNRRKNGEIYPELLSVNAIRDARGEVVNYVGVFTDITALKESQERLDFLAHHDPLTGLANRLLLRARLADAIERARRAGSRLAVLMLDLYHFKNVNDSLGHTAGDEVLAEVARRLRAALRASDLLARPGGDEFVVVVEELSARQEAGWVAAKLHAALAAPLPAQAHTLYPGASIGVSLFPADGADTDALLVSADAALHQAKEAGRDSTHFFAPELTAELHARLDIEADLRRALLHADELHLHYQPIVAAGGAARGFEALVRWRHPRLGLLPPGRFLPVAEESGLMGELDRHVLDLACDFLRRLDHHDHKSAGLYLAVNLSGPSFGQGGAHHMVEQALARSAAPAPLLEIEISEGLLRAQAERAAASFGALRGLGVRLAIDDFGTGYASLSFLKRLPVQVLKIDQSFVRGLPASSEDAALVRAIVGMASALGLETVAEGVETAEQFAFLREQGCTRMQGYHVARPMPEEQALAWLAAASAG